MNIIDFTLCPLSPRNIDEVPDEYEGLPIFTEARKTYYKETFRLRFSELLEKAYLAIK